MRISVLRGRSIISSYGEESFTAYHKNFFLSAEKKTKKKQKRDLSYKKVTSLDVIPMKRFQKLVWVL